MTAQSGEIISSGRIVFVEDEFGRFADISDWLTRLDMSYTRLKAAGWDFILTLRAGVDQFSRTSHEKAELYELAGAQLGLSPRTLQNYVSLARSAVAQIAISLDLEFAYAHAALGLDEDVARDLLTTAAEQGWEPAQVRKEAWIRKNTSHDIVRSKIEGDGATYIADSDDDVPFNHQPRQDVSPDEWTAIDEYEQGPVYTNGNGSVPHVSYNSGNNEWYTPKEYIEAARFVLGGIDLDPASSQAANEVVRASVFYTVEDDGLSRDWRGRVWMNPPYSEDLIGKFAGKLADHFAAGDVTAAIVLVNNATETRWFRRLIEVASAVVFPSSRVRFWRPDGKTAGPLQGQALIYMGEHPQKFREGFGSFGWGATL